MRRATTLFAVPLALWLGGCNVINTADSENARGRGPAAFDPYQGAQSGAIKLSLMQYNGCAILATGQPIAKGKAKIPYPDTCPDMSQPDPTTPITPAGQMKLVTGTKYFLGKFAITDIAFGLHKVWNDKRTPLTWMRKLSRFKNLDWSNVGEGVEEWEPVNHGVGTFEREISYENATWMTSLDDTLKIEVLDADGNVRGTPVTVKRKEFLGEGKNAGHSRATWNASNLGKPLYLGDTAMHPAADGSSPSFATIVRVDWAVSTDPFNSIQIPAGLTGDGALKVTWDKLPDEPFYFPVKFISKDQIPQTCYKVGPDDLPTDEKVACDFGLEYSAHFSTPKNGKFYVPGEGFDFEVTVKDASGHALHPKGQLPSYRDYLNGKSNGWEYINTWMEGATREAGIGEAMWRIAGPIDQFRYTQGTGTVRPSYFVWPEYQPHEFIEPIGTLKFLTGGYDNPVPTRFRTILPDNAKPGTYVLIVKGGRQFLGERTSQARFFFFQVGQTQATNYPGRVGNCQICHRGVLSLDNVMHGAPVDDVEACKACHDERGGLAPDFPVRIHRIHMQSRKFPLPKQACTTCHLTRESATRPSLKVCGSCHPEPHGGQYFTLEFEEPENTPNGFGTCATACHITQPPSQHILPAQ